MRSPESRSRLLTGAAILLLGAAAWWLFSWGGPSRSDSPVDRGMDELEVASPARLNLLLAEAARAEWRHQRGDYPDTLNGWWWSESVGVTLYYDMGPNATISPWVNPETTPETGLVLGDRRRGHFRGRPYFARKDGAFLYVTVLGEKDPAFPIWWSLTNLRASLPADQDMQDCIDVLLWRSQRIVGIDGEEIENPVY